MIAFGKGGALETVVSGETGLFFREQTADSLCEAIEEFEGRSWSCEKCREQAKRFSVEKFKTGIESVVKGVGL